MIWFLQAVAAILVIALSGSPNEGGAIPFTLVAKNSSISKPVTHAVSVPGTITFNYLMAQPPLGISNAYQSNNTSPASNAVLGNTSIVGLTLAK